MLFPAEEKMERLFCTSGFIQQILAGLNPPISESNIFTASQVSYLPGSSNRPSAQYAH